MRKTNVFGKKINHFKPLYFIALIFVLAVGGFFGVNYYQNLRLEALESEEAQIQAEINAIVNRQVVDYHDVDQILPNLPTTYDQLRLINELEFIRAVAGLSAAENYSTTFNEDAMSPFDTSLLPASVESVSITVSMLVPTIELVYAYMDQLIAQDRFYYISTATVTIPSIGSLAFTAVIYTFYNPVNV